MFSKIYRIIVSFAGESKQGYYDKGIDQYQFNSPWAMEENGGMPDNKYNLEINFHIGKYHDWKSNYGGSLSRLIKRFGNAELLKAYYDELNFIKTSKLYDLALFDDVEKSILEDVEEDETLKLPKTFSKIKIDSCKNKMLLRYLEKRCITQDIIDKYHIGYTEWDEDKANLRNRIIIPSYDSYGNLNYWVGRDYSEEYYKKKRETNPEFKYERMKYWNCLRDKKEIVFQESLINWDCDIVLVEGAMDCLYYTGNCVALLGKSLTKDSALYQRLVEKAKANIIICIDSDTDINEVKRIYKLLNESSLRGHIRYIRLDTYKDFGEAYEKAGRQGIIDVIGKQQEFTDFELNIIA